MTRRGQVPLCPKPEQRHLVKRCAARRFGLRSSASALGQLVQVVGGDARGVDKETEIEHRLYLGVREQVTRDLEQDPNVQFLVQRFGAAHHESIEPLNR
ncbi:DNA polymerase III subunit gamma/tau C-terminal domain-containing protein [Aeromonas salmonicida]|uniref:DNA polymerase III subunit gamma/tau C-terminal domain-containing protein n=1 Tax=Aeromonas salmonicida TaxID=645 RepID=UPI003421EAEC